MKNEISTIIKEWKSEPKEAAKRLLDHYGEPDEYTENRLIWHNTKDGWKRTILVDEAIAHDFPAPHHDFLEQFINYHVPVEKFNMLAEYDGSVVVERTKGEISARCGGTSMNFVAINLAHDIVTGKRTVKEARKKYTELYQAFQDGEKPPYTQGFQFELPQNNTGDPDVKTL
jgi:hypothetical protein